MGLTIKSTNEGNFIQVPPGMHLARCYRIIDLGTQKSEYMGQVRNLHKVMIQFEIHSENENGEPLQTSEGKPLILSKTYTASNNERSSLVKDLQTWRGKEFTDAERRSIEIANVLGQWGMVNVVETENNGRTYTNISSINPVPATIKKAGLPEGKNPTVIFDLDKFDANVFDSFSEGIQNKIKQSPEWQRVSGSSPTSTSADNANFDDMESDLPF
jgi:hypothetical protein